MNLWGNEIGDVSVVRHMPNLEVAGLTVNHIGTLEDFQYCTKMRELYLRGNVIPADIAQLRYLQHLPNLRILNLQSNPISTLPYFRTIAIKLLP